MRGRQFDRRTLTIAGVVVVLLVGFVLIFGDNIGLYGTAGKESEKQDNDGDGVPNQADQCPDQAGPANNNGCPAVAEADSDGDGVPDGSDNCPNQGDQGYGLTNGCPNPPPPPADSDGDGVPDGSDGCPNQGDQGYGLTNGCPNPPPPPADSDGDGVPDGSDGCPNQGDQGYGLTNGCPNPPPPPADSDGDGVPDGSDNCPNQGDQGYGLTNGCPNPPPPPADSDGDGVVDTDDQCPNQGDQGYGLTNGCPNPAPPPADSDGDGVVDTDDQCPNQGDQGYGLDATGCPNPAPPPADSDGDGVVDTDDQCPDQGDQGNGVDASGCPNPAPLIVDTDGDGVPDNSDQCPTQAGLQADKGCPKEGQQGVSGEWDRSSLSVNASCDAASGTVTFTVTNDGNRDMAGPTTWTLYDDDAAIQSGEVGPIPSGGSQQLTFAGVEGKLRLVVNQRPGHPGTGVTRADVDDCVSQQPPALTLDGVCDMATGIITFTVTNTGGAMTSATNWNASDGQSSTLQLGAGESVSFTVAGDANGNATFNIPDLNLSKTVSECLPPPPPPSLTLDGVCDMATGIITFTVTNTGGAMGSAANWDASDGQSGTLQLGAGESTSFTVAGDANGNATFNIPDYNLSKAVEECLPPPPPPALTLDGVCDMATGIITFTVTNTGGPMDSAANWDASDGQSGTLQLGAGESASFTVAGDANGNATFNIPDLNLTKTVEECLPPPPPPALTLDGVCDMATGIITFTVTNTGGPMDSAANWDASDGQSGTLQLGAGESASFTVAGDANGNATFNIPDLNLTKTVEECLPPPEKGGLSVTKSVQGKPADGPFEVCITGPSFPNGDCQSIEDGQTVTWSDLEPGEYTVSETDPGVEWTVSGEGAVTVESGQTASATITNESNARYTICHVAGLAEQPANYVILRDMPWQAIFGQAGHFFENGTPRAGHEQDFVIDGVTHTEAECAPPAPSLTLDGVCDMATGIITFTVTNTGDAMTSETAWNASDGQSGTLQLGAGESASFTVAGDANGNATFNIPDLNLTKTAEECLPPPPPPSLTLDGVCDMATGIITFTVTNTGGPMDSAANWDASDGQSGTLQLGAGESASFTVAGDANGNATFNIPDLNLTKTVEECLKPPEKGNLLVSKAVKGKPTDQTFEICITGPSFPNGDCQTISDGETATWSDLEPGEYTVSETDPGAEWTVSGTGAVTVNSGETASVTVTNEEKARYTICHVAGLAAQPANYIILRDMPWQAIFGQAGHFEENGTPRAGHEQDFFINTPEDEARCAPPPLGSLTVNKVVEGDAPAGQTFEVCITGPSFPDGDCQTISAGGSATWSDLEPGEYTVSETDPGANWSVSGEGGVTVSGGGDGASATITNTYTPPNGALEVTKSVKGKPSDQTFEICITGPSFPDGDCQTISDGETATWDDLEPGEYTVSETDPGPTWNVSGTGAVTVNSGETASVTVTNDDNERYTICHVAGLAAQPANYIILRDMPWQAIFGQAGHFEENGTPRAGHEQDFLITSPEDEARCAPPPLGSLTVNKVVEGNAPVGTEFEICITGPSYPNGDCQMVSAGGSAAWSDLEPGEYTVSETDPGVNWSVSGEGPVTVSSEGPASATITNTYTPPNGALEVTKAVKGKPSDQTFEICITGPSFPNGDCKTISDGQTATWDDLEPGEYTVSESDPGPTWNVSGTGAVTVNSGETASVTVTNDNNERYTICHVAGRADQPANYVILRDMPWQAIFGQAGHFEENGTPRAGHEEDFLITSPEDEARCAAPLGSLTVNKVVEGGEAPAGTEFEICITGPSYPNGDCQMVSAGGSVTWSDLEPGEYTVSETDPGPAWEVSGEGPVTVTGGGDGASVTITNTLKPGRLDVTKAVDWNGAEPFDVSFEICITGPSFPDGDCKTVKDGETASWEDLLPGEYTVSETDPGVAWVVSGEGGVTVNAGESGSATITNTLQLGRLDVTKAVDWNGAEPFDVSFEICITGPSYPDPDCKTVKDGETASWEDLLPGEYTVSETDPGVAWAVSGEGGVTVNAGESGSATITNTLQLGRLDVTKAVDWNGAEPFDVSFEICITGPSYPDPDCKTVKDGETASWEDLLPGEYTVSETDPGVAWVVSGEGGVTVNAGESGSATITNTLQLGRLDVTKAVDWNGAEPFDVSFEICITGPSYPDPDCKTVKDGETASWEDLLPGEYTVSETDPGVAWAVSGEGGVTVNAGESGSATITNTLQLGRLEVTKVVEWGKLEPDANQTFEICVTGPSYPDPDCQTVGSDGGTVVWEDLLPGTYTVTETDPGTTWIVSGSGVDVIVNAGETATHTITNSTEWDKSSLSVQGSCDTSTYEAVFSVTNTGDGDMQGPTTWRLYADDTQIQSGTVGPLASGASAELRFPGIPGKLRLEVDQRAGHPGEGVTRTDVDACTPVVTPPQLTLVGQCVGTTPPSALQCGVTEETGGSGFPVLTDMNAANCAATQASLGVNFTVTNVGGPMTAPVGWTASDGQTGQLGPLATGESMSFAVIPDAAGAAVFSVDELQLTETIEGCLKPWTPIEVGAGVCPDWFVYHTNQTGDWEIFRLGEFPGAPGADPNLTQGVGPRVYDVSPTRSPDSQWIAFASNRDGNWEIYVGRADGTFQQRVTYAVEAIDIDPAWSPAGTYIAYESARDGNWELYMVDVATGAETRLTNDPASDLNAFWSPDGSKLVFQSDRDGFWQIYELDIATLAVTKLSDGIGDDLDPQYSNNGQTIAFRSMRDGQNGVIYVMNADGSNVRAISDPNGDALNHAFSPDDTLIAYQSNLDGDSDIYVYEFASEQTRLVTDNTIPDYAPTWYCNAPTVIFTSDITQDSNVFDTSALPISAPPIKVETDASQLTDEPLADQYPQDSPSEENASREGTLPRPAKNK